MNDPVLNLPRWMRETRHSDCQRNGRAVKTSTVEKTIRGIARVLQDNIYAEQVAARDGLLQRIDPRVKIIGLVLLLIAAAFAANPLTLVALYLFLLFVAAWSAIPVSFFIKRVWLFIPLFAVIIILPSLFNVVRPGDPLWTIWEFDHEVTLGPWSLGTSLAITRQGVVGGFLLVMRVAVSVSLAVLVALTTRWAELLRALRYFHVPAVIVLVLSMTYRYIYLLLGLATDMYVARSSRLAGSSSPREDRHFTAASIGALLGKSHELSGEVYSAMVSRGYTGEPRIGHHLSLRAIDLVAGATLLMMAALTIGGERVLG
jgi:cobalt/nickel transport system permease protein